MMHELLSRKITSNLHTALKTEPLLDHILTNMSPLKKFWYERLHDGGIQFGDQQWNVAAPYNIDTLFDDFVKF